MPQLLPFVGLRPQATVTGALDDVICPPYDVITDDQRAQLVERSPYNAVRVELPNGDYEGAAALLATWQKEGAFVAADRPALYGYRMTYQAPTGRRRQTLGVIGALALEAPGQGILPHEQTTPKAKSDRLELLRATRTNTSPIWCLCSEPGLAAALGPVPESAPVMAAVDDESTLHEIWPVEAEPALKAVASVVEKNSLLVADGHHRYETALAYQSEAGSPSGAGAVLALVVELSEEHLDVLAIHRALAGLPAGFDLAGALAAHFDLVPTAAQGGDLLDEMVGTEALGLVTLSGRWLALPKPGGLASGHGLDSSRADAVLATLPPHQLAYEHDVARAEADIRSGQLQAAVFCRPATVSQIAQTAHGGHRMPPKTTFFWPKPRTGLVFRPLP